MTKNSYQCIVGICTKCATQALKSTWFRRLPKSYRIFRFIRHTDFRYYINVWFSVKALVNFGIYQNFLSVLRFFPLNTALYYFEAINWHILRDRRQLDIYSKWTNPWPIKFCLLKELSISWVWKLLKAIHALKSKVSNYKKILFEIVCYTLSMATLCLYFSKL